MPIKVSKLLPIIKNIQLCQAIDAINLSPSSIPSYDSSVIYGEQSGNGTHFTVRILVFCFNYCPKVSPNQLAQYHNLGLVGVSFLI
jgi:hypothetical protein